MREGNATIVGRELARTGMRCHPLGIVHAWSVDVTDVPAAGNDDRFDGRTVVDHGTERVFSMTLAGSRGPEREP